MKFFQTVQANYELLGISLAQSFHHFPHNPKIFIGSVIFGLTTASFIVHIFQEADSFKDYIECVTTTSACLIIAVCFGAVVFKMTELFENINDMEKVITMKSKCPASMALFGKTNQEVEKWTKIIFFVVMKLSLPSIMLPVCLGSIIIYTNTEMGSDSFLLPIPMWFPFDTKNPVGYLIAFSIIYFTVGYLFFVVACSISLGIGSYFLVMAAVQDLKRILRSINKCVKSKSEQKRRKINQNLSQFIEMHSTMKRLVQRFGVIAQPIFMALFTWALVATCACMLALQIQMIHHNMSPLELLLLLSEAIYGFFCVFIASELGQRVTNAFNELSFRICQFRWYLFPMKIKRLLPIITLVAQEPVLLECFGSISLCRDVFKRIVNTAFSYFMLLRRVIK